MTGQLFISLLNPAVTFLLCSAFLVLWYHRRERFILLIALAFISCAGGFVVQDIVPVPDYALGRLLTNGLFSAAILFACAAFIARYRASIPYASWTITLGIGTVAFVWYLYVDPRLDARIYVFNATFAIVVIATMAALHEALRLRSVVDYLIIALFATTLLSLVVRPMLVLWDSAPYQSAAGFETSVYWATVQFAAVIVSVSVALTLLVAVTLQLIGELRVESRTDHLSGVLNRRGFEEEAGAALAACIGSSRPSVMIMADLDHFKRINDAYGHGVGDAVIARFGTLLAQTGNATAVIGRLGGEEFAVFLPGGNQHAARTFAEAVRSAYLSVVVEGVPSGASLTASFGIRTHAIGDSLYDLMQGSDKALYMAKTDGRDRVNVASVPLRSVPALA